MNTTKCSVIDAKSFRYVASKYSFTERTMFGNILSRLAEAQLEGITSSFWHYVIVSTKIEQISVWRPFIASHTREEKW